MNTKPNVPTSTHSLGGGVSSAHEQHAQMLRLDARGIRGPAFEAVSSAHAVTRGELAKMDHARLALMTARESA